MLGWASKEQKVDILVSQMKYTLLIAGRAMHPSKDAHAPISKIRDSVTLHVKWGFKNVIKRLDLEMGRSL